MSITPADMKAVVTARLKAVGWIDGALLSAVAVFALVQLGRGELSSAATGFVVFTFIAEMIMWKTEARKWQARYEEAVAKPTGGQEVHFHAGESVIKAEDAHRQAQKIADLRSLTHHDR